MKYEKKFSKWFNEIEGFALRGERFYDDLDTITGIDKTASEASRNTSLMLDWLKAAYEEGYNQARYDTMKLYWDDGK